MRWLVPILLTPAFALAQNWDDPFADIPYALPRGYHDPLGVFFELQKAAESHAGVAMLRTLGSSHEGRPLPALVLSDEVGSDETGEPRVFLGGALHGDEAGTQELLVRLQKHLLERYGLEPRITRLLNGLELVIAPTLNPDGVMKGRRGNAQGIDLNRDCPLDGTPTARETKNLVEFFSSAKVDMALVFHAGGAAFVLPWDNRPNDGTAPAPIGISPLEAAGRAYASRHPLLSVTSGPRYLQPGLVHGYEWYPVPNSLPDCVNAKTGTPMASVEIGLTRMPGDLDALLNENLESILSALETFLPER